MIDFFLSRRLIAIELLRIWKTNAVEDCTFQPQYAKIMRNRNEMTFLVKLMSLK